MAQTNGRPTAADLKALDDRAGGIDDNRWGLAELAADWKARGVEHWAAVIAAHPRVRREPRTVYEWADVAEFRNALPVRPALPFSFYARALRFADRVEAHDLIEALETAEAEAGVSLKAFCGLLADFAKPEPEPDADPYGQAVDSVIEAAARAQALAPAARGEAWAVIVNKARHELALLEHKEETA